MDAAAWIRQLELQPHPEGGWYRETYRATETIAGAALPARYGAARSVSTAIYFLLQGSEISTFHRLASDELWHYHVGGPLEVVMILADGTLRTLLLGPDPTRGESLQAVIPAGCWFGARLVGGAPFVLVGCTVAPGFDFSDFDLAQRSALQAQYPQHAALIAALTHG